MLDMAAFLSEKLYGVDRIIKNIMLLILHMNFWMKHNALSYINISALEHVFKKNYDLCTGILKPHIVLPDELMYGIHGRNRYSWKRR
jgi:hypothetical protein